MKFQLRSLVTALAMVFSIASGNSARAVDIYATLWENTSQKPQFGKINTDTGVYTQISADTGGPNQELGSGLAWNPTINAFNSTTDYGSFSSLSLTGVDSLIATGIGVELLLSYDTSTSTMYGLSYNAFKTINPATGATVTLGNPGVSQVFGSALLNGTLYSTFDQGSPPFSFDNRFGTINLSNGAKTPITTADNSLYSGMKLASDGTTLFGIKLNNIYTINPATGSSTLLRGITGISSNASIEAISTVTVPEPSTYALGVIATGVMAFLARRRRARGV
jgi:hypothetical protein